ncbi:hypothetical protein GJV85_11720 [Sulfurimonas aquatica]|uniref:FecR protein domain-containing protein n=1 Tax=Sulfurimonas aquatica TaxID=2672570 RepID=A0A975B269_9BACT|nr:FecR family protein [Sulfurimonas aquatica]QSZ42753.1 hypothetical protein GJV85_11720 [Sulfurimonas aquatica]
MIKILLALLLAVSLWAQIGQVMAMKGKAYIDRAGAEIPVKNLMEVYKDDKLITKDKTRVQIKLNDDTILTIGQNAIFTFEKFYFDGTDKSEVTMNASRGFFRSVTGKIGKLSPERFKVKTASATIGIRGTDFSGDIRPDKEIIKCYSGAITIDYLDAISTIDAGMSVELSKNDLGTKELKVLKNSLFREKKIEKKIDKKRYKEIKEIEEDDQIVVIENVEDTVIQNRVDEIIKEDIVEETPEVPQTPETPDIPVTTETLDTPNVSSQTREVIYP